MQDRLPKTLDARGFVYRDGVANGLTPGVLRGPRFAVPHRGVRALESPVDPLGRALAFAPLLRPWQCFGGASALALLGLPIPPRMCHGDVEVVSATGRGHPQRPGVRVRRLVQGRVRVTSVDGVRVASAPLAWALAAGACTVHELVRIGDAIVSDAGNYPDRRLPGPLATIDDLRDVLEGWDRGRGVSKLRAALPRIRERVESPRETDMRLFIVDAGLPEPEVQVSVHDPADGRLLGRADLLHRDARVVEEYEGAGHRAEHQWDRDIQKYRDFARIGLHVVRATNRDFVPSPERWLTDLAAVLRARSRP